VAQDIGGSGLGDAIEAAAAQAGWERLTSLQEAALPVLRRGGNAVLHASSGAGVTAAWALPLLSRLAEAEGSGLRALVLAPTAERAESVARAAAELAGESGIAVRPAAPGWRAQGAAVLVATPDRVLAEVQGSAVKLDGVDALVLVDAAVLFGLYGAEMLGTLVGLVPRDAQRIVATADLTPDVTAWVDAHARRALTIPSRPADPREVPQREPIGQLGYLTLGEIEKPAMLARLLDGVEGDTLVRVRTARRVEAVQRELARRGVTDGSTVTVAPFGADVSAPERVISFDVPFSAEELRRCHESGGTVFVSPAEMQHLRRMADEVPFTLKQRRARALDETELDAFRSSVRAALDAEDLQAQLLILDPLFESHPPAEVAAALSALLRRRGPPQRQASAGEAGPAPAQATASGLTRLFISIGARDNVRPGDLVGAITGEAGIRGEQVGRVDIRDTFSVVEVAGAVAEKVIRALNGTTMRGRSLRVDFDRKGASSGPSDAGRGAGPRRPRPGGGPPRRRPQSS
jgi:ATP-dependent RNA helicase DeaD